jgi:hypothetical protein
MPPEVIERLMTMGSAVITRVTRDAEGRIRIIAVSDTHTFSIVMEGCAYQDARCDECGCDKSKVTLQVERIP